MSTEIKESEVVQPEKKSKSKGNGKPVEDTAIVPRGDVDLLMVEAVRSGNIEVMERVMAIRRELKAEAAREAFFAAFAAFRSECPVIPRTKPVYNSGGTKILYHYASLDQIEKVVGPIIARHGLSYSFKAHIEKPVDKDAEADLVMECHVQHEAGHVEVSPFRLPISGEYMNKNQQRGNTNSYAKRYSFANAFGIMTEDEDNDGVDRRLVPDASSVSAGQLKELQKLLDLLTEARQKKALAYLQVEGLEDLPAKKYTHALSVLTKAAKAGGEPLSQDQEATLQALIEEIGGNCKQEFLSAHKIEKLSDLPAGQYQGALLGLQEKRRAV